MNNPPNAPYPYYCQILKNLENRTLSQGKNLSLFLANLMFLVSLKGDGSTMAKFTNLEMSLRRLSQSVDFQPTYNKFTEVFTATDAIMSKNREKESKTRNADEINNNLVFDKDEIDRAILAFLNEIFRLHILWILWQKTTKMLVRHSLTLATSKVAIPPLLLSVERCEEALKILDSLMKRLEEKYDSDKRELNNMKESDEYKEMVSKFNASWDELDR